MNLALNSLKDSNSTTYCSELFHLIPFIPLNYIPLSSKLNCYFYTLSPFVATPATTLYKMIKKLSHFVMKVEVELFCVLLSVVADCE